MILLYISLTVIFICLIKSLILIKSNLHFYQNFLWLYLAITFSLEFYGIYKMAFKEYDFAYLFNYYCIFLILFFYIYYFKLLSKNLKKINSIIFLIILIFIIFLTKFYGNNFDIRLGLLVSFYFIINTLFWFYYRLKKLEHRKIIDNPNFWISSGLLLWSIFFIFRSLPMFFLSENDPAFLQLLKTIQYGVNIIMYSMFYIALLKFENGNN